MLLPLLTDVKVLKQLQKRKKKKEIYIYTYIIFGQVKTEFGVIPSGQENLSRAEHLNFPGRELNVIYYRAIFL